ncbi:MAG TPA: GNAT family N-acetyltransferase [Albitalea sp.]|uniref:GNAT family N-acetyltransferase n=1 Tax=Piscinibacter sp. TaxID=1903157 RepID=UPI002ED410CE
MPVLRRVDVRDAEALADICVRTGDAGADASVLYPDPQLLADIFLRPYLHFEPDWCWGVEDGAGLAGYLVATPDTLAFARRSEPWWQALRRRHPLPDPDDERPQARLVRRAHVGVLTELPFIGSHPAHLHVDLLPRMQGQGWGAALMKTLLDARLGIGVHLAVARQNQRAFRFYERQGFEVLEQTPWGCWMGHS